MAEILKHQLGTPSQTIYITIADITIIGPTMRKLRHVLHVTWLANDSLDQCRIIPEVRSTESYIPAYHS